MKYITPIIIITLMISSCQRHPINRAEFEVLQCSDGDLTILPRYNPFNFYSNKRILLMNLLEKIDNTVAEDSIKFTNANGKENLASLFEGKTAATYEDAAVAFMDYRNNPCDFMRQETYLELMQELFTKQFELDTYQRMVYSIYRQGELDDSDYKDIRSITDTFLEDFDPVLETTQAID